MGGCQVRHTSLMVAMRRERGLGLVTNYGEGEGGYKTGGGHLKFYPREKGGLKKF